MTNTTLTPADNVQIVQTDDGELIQSVMTLPVPPRAGNTSGYSCKLTDLEFSDPRDRVLVQKIDSKFTGLPLYRYIHYNVANITCQSIGYHFPLVAILQGPLGRTWTNTLAPDTGLIFRLFVVFKSFFFFFFWEFCTALLKWMIKY